MKLLKNIFYLSASAVMLTSCSDFLEKTPHSLVPETYFTDETSAYNFLSGIYGQLSGSGLYSENYTYLVGGDDLTFYNRSNTIAQSGMICNNLVGSDSNLAEYWLDLYIGINRANILIREIERVDMADNTRARFTAEARFLRAYYYFMLVQGWGDVPFYTEPTERVTGLDRERTDKQEIYDFILREMDEAAANLPSASSMNYLPGRVSMETAWGIMARVYLFRAGEYHRDKRSANADETSTYYLKAAEYAKKVIDTDRFGLAANYWDVFIDLAADKYNTTAKESLWEVEYAGDNTTTARAAGRVGNVNGLQCTGFVSGEGDRSLSPGYSYGFLGATPLLYMIYQANGDTERLNWNIAPFTYATKKVGQDQVVAGKKYYPGKRQEVESASSYGFTRGTLYYADYRDDFPATSADAKDFSRCAAKFRREYEVNYPDKNWTPVNFPILRYSDVLLMYAEAVNQTGQSDVAVDYINKVRMRAGIRNLEHGLSTAEVLQAIKDERAMEFCFELTRRWDLIRWGDYVERMHEVAAYARANAGGVWRYGAIQASFFDIPDSYVYFPIPSTEMSVNKLIGRNNPGW